ncbi:MAG: carboxypeptidase regulatory-like domain-containing protein [Balneolaceae bacterium]
MRISFTILGALFLSFFIESESPKTHIQQESTSIYRNAVISGTVTLPPASSTSNRRFRGSAYRNRGGNSASEQSGSSSNRFIKTVVSAHPTSYTITDLPISSSVIIGQENAEFIPPITPVTVGSTVQFVNNDSFYHNVFSLTPGAKFNIGRRPTGDVYSKEVPPTKWKVSGLGPIDLFCDIHSQMNAVILSLDTPYFTTVNEDGTYSLGDLPEGTYELRVYNKDFELFTQKITVAESEQYEVNFNLTN